MTLWVSSGFCACGRVRLVTCLSTVFPVLLCAPFICINSHKCQPDVSLKQDARVTLATSVFIPFSLRDEVKPSVISPQWESSLYPLLGNVLTGRYLGTDRI